MGIGANTRKAWERRTGQQLGHADTSKVTHHSGGSAWRDRRLGEVGLADQSWAWRGRGKRLSGDDRLAELMRQAEAGILVYSRYPRLNQG